MQFTNAVVARFVLMLLTAVTASGGLSSVAAGQREQELDATTLRQVIHGRVCWPDDSPASGAVVVSSAGGEVVTGADGAFTLAVELPLDAESLEVTAVAGAGPGNLVASARVVPAALA